MVTIGSKTTLVTAVAGLLLALVVLPGCTPKPEGPGPAAEKFLAALSVGDTATAAQLSDNPNEAREALNAAWAGLQATHLDAQVLSSKYAEDTGTVVYRFTWHLPKDRTWSYDGQLKMARDEDTGRSAGPPPDCTRSWVSTRRSRCGLTSRGGLR